MPIYGDSGAFSYFRQEQPPHTSAQVLDFYADGAFTHGCSLDHIILDIPQALENLRLIRAAREGSLNQESLIGLERKALEAVRGYDRGIMEVPL